MVLLIAVGVGLFTIVKNQFFEEEAPVAKFISTPWKTIAGMMECGVWQPIEPTRSSDRSARKDHPNHFKRMLAGAEEE